MLRDVLPPVHAAFPLLLLLALLLPATGHGQRAGPDSVGAPTASVIERLGPGDRVRVTAPLAWRIEGRVASPVGDTLLLEAIEHGPGDTLRIPVEAVQRLWIRVPRTGRGAWIGAGAGGVLGGVTGALLGAGLCDAADCTAATWEGAARGAAVVGVAGLAVGALVGSLSRGWVQIHP